MAKSKTTSSRLRQLTRCACLAGLVLVHLTGCGSPSNSTGTADAGASPERSTAADTAATADAPKAGAGAQPRPEADTSAAGVKLSGRVLFDGAPPERRVINTSKDAACAKLHGDQPVLDEDLIVSESGGIRNAFVYLRRGAPKRDYPLPEKPAELNQQGCMFRPRVQGVRAGQPLLVGNGDPVTHNVRSFPILNPAFNFGQPPETEARERIFEKAEREIEVQCDIHPWMHAYVFVMDHPFYSVSDDDGTYAIDDLPPGEYTLECWHEKLGKQRQSVTVGDRLLVDVNFTYQQ